MNRNFYVRGRDPFVLFDEICSREAIDPGHAFYLGHELSKARTALELGKNYIQDQSLHWGFLTVPEVSHRATMRLEKEERDQREGNQGDGQQIDQ